MTDTRIYRTELEQPSACGGRWGLYVDGRLIARTDRALDHAAAQAWACSQLGPRVLPARRWNMGGRSPDLTSWYCARCSTWSHCANESLRARGETRPWRNATKLGPEVDLHARHHRRSQGHEMILEDLNLVALGPGGEGRAAAVRIG